MNQQMNKDCCYLCDTYLTSIPNKVKKELENGELEIILTVKKYLPTINKWQFDLICESCLNYILDFDEVRKKWEINESVFKQKTQDRSKGLRDISKSKNKKCTYICRLCLKAITTQEVTFVYHDDQVYESSYVHKMLSLHSPHTDLSLTENPVICNECLDEVQTFDAFHQMWMEVQNSQVQSSGCKYNSCDSGVVQQLRKFDENRETRCNLMEEISIGSILSNAENLPSDMLALTNGISAGISSNDDILLISDDEEMENKINSSVKIGVDTSTEAERAVRGLLNVQDSVCGTPVEFHNQICTVSGDENMIEPSIDTNQNSSAISRVSDLAQIIPLKENIPPDISNDDFRQVNLSKSKNLPCENESVVLFSSGQVEDNSVTYNDGFSLENVASSSWPVQKKIAFVEIDDSDSQDSDDCEEINMPSLPKISNVCSVNENDIPMNETKIIEDNNSLQHFASNTDFSNVSPAEITPSLEINMTKVKELFQTSPGDAILVLDDENEVEISPQDVPSLELNMSKVKELFQDVDNRESNLKENLSDFLKFNKPNNSKRGIDESSELLDYEHQIELDARVKKFKVDADSKSPPKNDNCFSSAFSDYVEAKEKMPEHLESSKPNKSFENVSINRMFHTLCFSSESSSNSKNSAEALDILSIEDIFECYCKWYPYKPRFSSRGSSISKIKATVMENSVGSQIYQCNKCLFATDKECELVNHHCVKKTPKERFWCRKRKCRFSSKQEKQFVLHNLFHNIVELGWLKCTVCEFRALDDLSMSKHHKQSHQMGIVQRHSKCPNCYFESDEPQILSHHIRTRHYRLHKNTTTYEKNKKV